MAELADAQDLGSCAFGVQVQALLPAPKKHDSFDNNLSETIVLFLFVKFFMTQCFSSLGLLLSEERLPRCEYVIQVLLSEEQNNPCDTGFLPDWHASYSECGFERMGLEAQNLSYPSQLLRLEPFFPSRHPRRQNPVQTNTVL